ncbi:chromate transporter [Cohnella algarum]|uniref:chromate transporter n=1 Tax=Cohnella algarum TaxID=2044859 RepID=UPI00196792C4|nr:chromate transporter [Cohnella algarum]MBN2980401.1 chromate transporter [Cohnella algarum]
MTSKGKERLGMIGQLFWTFLRIGPATFGGGYAMMPLIEREVAHKKGWIEEKELADLVSLAGSAPGGVGVNAAAFVGYRKAGISGAIAAVAGIALPTFLIVLALSLAYVRFRDSEKVRAALTGVQGAVIALMLLAAYRMAKSSVFDVSTAVVSVAALTVLLATNLNPVYIVLAGLVVGILLVKGKERLGLNVKTEKNGPNGGKAELYYPEYYI